MNSPVFLAFFRKLEYIYTLIIETPYFYWIIFLQVLSGFFTIAGLPLLIPVLDYLKADRAGNNNVAHQDVLNKIFELIGIEPSINSVLFFASLFIILGQFLLFASNILAAVAQLEISKEYRKKILYSYSKVSWLWLTKDKSGKMNHAILREADMAGLAHLSSQRIIISFIQVVALLFVSVRLSLNTTIIALIVYSGLFIINSWNSRNVGALSEKFNETFKKVATATANLQQNKKFFKSSLLYEGVLKTIFAYVNQTVKIEKGVILRMQLQNSWNFLASFFFIVCLIIFRDMLGLCFSELLVILLVFQRLGPQYDSFYAAYLTLNTQIPIHQSIKQRLKDLESNREPSGTETFLFDQPIRFDAVSFKYPEGEKVIDNISIEIKPFTTVALVGSSGGGKSTILDLFLGLLKPDSGSIYYGNIPFERLDIHSFRDKIAYVSQETTLLDGTLLENLTIGCPKATDETIRNICRRVHIDDLISTLPDGIQTEVGENGIKLSGGQRQRIALGRALLMNPSILILDEATSELDTESERFIQDTLHELRRDITIIMVAHRISTVKYSDVIYVIENGDVCETGTYDELLKKKGRFYYLDSLQNGTSAT